jgi:LmbE family N-acetylglucosaminyl deacetylase
MLGCVRKLLIVGAHPDDETFFAGGTIAKYAAEGTRISVVCATRGERGATADLCSIAELPKVREGELRDAMQILGVAEVDLLSYEDQKLAEAPVEETRRQLVEAIRKTRPQIVMTFDPNGSNRHTDHMAISRFTSDALAAAADPRWYPELGAAHTIERLVWQPPTLIFRYPSHTDLTKEPGIDFLIDTSRWSEKKAAAIRAYRTQRLDRLFFDDPDGRRTFSTEAFRVGWGLRPKSVPADDLFAE